ncbi:MAG TPA: SLC13 family permease [Nocardioidaceae bacterium]|nr:SLC13 family permease [Nocardioidaceae bacterium]
MSPEIISILVLVAMFVVATLLPIHIGVMAFVAAFVVGSTLAGLDGETILEDGLPDELAVTLIGITLLFAMAQANGTIDWLVRLAVRAVRGRLVAIPWVMFLMAGVLTAFGAVSAAAVAIIAPVALGFAYRFKINPLLMGVMVVHGAQAGGFSPTSIYGTITNDAVQAAELPGSPLILFLSSFFFNLAIGVVSFVIFGGLSLMRRRTDDLAGADAADGGGGLSPAGASGGGAGAATLTRPTGPGAATATPTRSPETSGSEEGSSSSSPTPSPTPGPSVSPAPVAAKGGGVATKAPPEEEDEGPAKATPYQLLTVLGILGLGVATLVYELDIGLVAMTVALVLALVSPKQQKSAIQHISWPVVLLISGMLTYIYVLEEMGTIEWAGQAVAGVGAAVIAALLLAYVGGFVSAFASSTALLPVIIPMAVPILAGGEVGAIGAVSAIAVATTIVDVSPFSTNGAIVLANSSEEDQDRVYKGLLIFGASVVVIAPLLAWLVLVVPGWL